MYEKYYGLRERPFDLTPNPKYLFLTARHREALSNIQYGISGRKGITLLIGEAGTGKTTLVRTALATFQPRGVFGICVNNPALTRDEFYEFLAGRFGLSAEAASSKARFLIELEENVVQRHKAGGITALLIDEAQSLPVELLEEVRLLANLETATVKLMPLVLAGQPELAVRLDDPEHRQLKQRIALRCDLMPLTIQETAAYIAGRIRIAGGDVTRMFTRDAVELIHRRSRGIPRTISVICDNALIGGLAAGVKPVGRHIVIEVCRDFKMAAADSGADAVDKAAAAAPAEPPPTAAPQPVVARPAATPPSAAARPAPSPPPVVARPAAAPRPAAARPAAAPPPVVARPAAAPPPAVARPVVARPAAAQLVAAETRAVHAAVNPLADLTARLRAKLQPPAGTVETTEDGQQPAEQSPARQVQQVPPSILLLRDDD